MVTRREVLTGGVAGSLAGGLVGEVAFEQNAAQLNEIAGNIDELKTMLERSIDGPSVLANMFLGEIRKGMIAFLKANQHFPDFIDIGINVFLAMYDWHIRNQQQLIVTRGIENRYTMQFMFSMLVLRPEVDGNFIGFPYDKG
jgi:hypothetical protein